LPISELKCDNQIYAQRIDPCKLHDPSHGNRSDRRGKSKQIVKKVYKTAIDVACRPFIHPNSKEAVQISWEHIEEERITIGELYLELTGLLKNVNPDKFISTESSSCPETSNVTIKSQMTELKLYDDIFNEKILPVEEGIRLHRTETKSLDKTKALKIFKMAADGGNADAQLLYAFTLPKTKKNRENFLSYLKKAADNGKDIAMYHLADIYLNGKRNIPCNKQLGLRYLKLSALKKNELSLRLVKAMNVNIYDSNDFNDSDDSSF
ncbi:21279_t:CDS:2, partial [Racocetra persica]